MSSRRQAGAASSGCAVVIGLGGGGLPVFLHRFLGMSVEAVELDATVVSLARRHFGFQEEPGLRVSISRAPCLCLPASSRRRLRPSFATKHPRVSINYVRLQRRLATSHLSVLQSHPVNRTVTQLTGTCNDMLRLDEQAAVGDGLVALAAAAESDPGSLDVVVVDAGSGDASLAMSCPPAAFLEQPFLRNACTALRPGGLLAVNCVTRLDATFLRAAQAIQVTG